MPYCMFVKYSNEKKRRENPIVIYRTIGLGTEIGLFLRNDKTIEDILVKRVTKAQLKKNMAASFTRLGRPKNTHLESNGEGEGEK